MAPALPQCRQGWPVHRQWLQSARSVMMLVPLQVLEQLLVSLMLQLVPLKVLEQLLVSLAKKFFFFFGRSQRGGWAASSGNDIPDPPGARAHELT